MFERYTEKARRVIFLARYEATQYGSPTIDSEHLFLALLRENESLGQWIPKAQPDEIRRWIDAQTPQRPGISTRVDLPLSNSSKMILKAGADEADRLAHRHIGTEHLFLGLFAVEDCLAAKLLRQAGADPVAMRLKLSEQTEFRGTSLQRDSQLRRQQPFPGAWVEIHGIQRKADYIRDVVSMIRAYNWHWQKTVWKPRDIVVHRKTGQVSFETVLARNSETFMLVRQGWKRDHCFLCRWELHESGDEHGAGYTNGRNWLCMECCERFILNDFFSSSHSDIT
jgi:ATP-dependent Clp protease ATP-binding subunit ClpA